MTPHLAEALKPMLCLAARGWRLLPCVACAKTPLIRDWPRRASCDFDVICRWARRHERCNWAVATGPPSGVFVIDVDGESGKISFCSLVEQYGTWAKTLTATTARGQHFYFTYPVTGTVRNSTGKLGAGLDVRGDGGYVLIPPSTHPSGARYEWANPLNGLAPAPAWLLEKIVTGAARPIEASEIGILPAGRRNDGLTRVGGYLRRKGLSLAEIETVLMEQNARRCRPQLQDDEVRKIAVSVSRYDPGGPDPLETAWQTIQGESHNSRYEQFVSLVCQLQRSRPGQPVILPLERIATLMGCGWTSIRGYRKQAVMARLICRVADPVPHRRAAEYRVTLPPEKTVATMGANPATPAITPINGLVAIRDFSRSGRDQNHHGGRHRSMVATQESMSVSFMTAKWKRRINVQREVVNLLHDFAHRLRREFGVRNVSAKAQLAEAHRQRLQGCTESRTIAGQAPVDGRDLNARAAGQNEEVEVVLAVSLTARLHQPKRSK